MLLTDTRGRAYKPLTPEVSHHRARIAALSRDRLPDDPELLQARRALALARTEVAIRRAIEAAPPLDPDALARIRALIPAVPAKGEVAR